MRSAALFWKLLAGNTLLLALVLSAGAWLITSGLESIQLLDLSASLPRQAAALVPAVEGRFDQAHAAELRRIAQTVAETAGGRMRITLLLPDGRVLADSRSDMLSDGERAPGPEVRQALEAGWGEDTRNSPAGEGSTRYAALRVGPAEAPTGVIRLAVPLEPLGRRPAAIQRIVVTTLLLTAAGATVFGIGLARLWSNPLRRILVIARSLSSGDLTARARESGNDEMAVLARSLNRMRDELLCKLETIDHQRRTLESLLSQLHEGVIVAGPDHRIVLINPAAVRMLGLASGPSATPAAVVGLAVERCVRQLELQRMLEPSASGTAGSDGIGRATSEARIQIDGEGGEIFLLAYASDISLPPRERPGPDRQAPAPALGRLLVLLDITELNRTVQVKVDFASNASHELRTPLSAIRAAVETLNNLDPVANPEAARHFLNMIDRHSSRMEDMVSDLLDLSKIETSPTQFRPETLNLVQQLNALHNRFIDRLEQKQLRWRLDLPEQPGVFTVNPYLLRLVLDNLVDNAVKFTEPGGTITVGCVREPAGDDRPETLTITVSDTGCGIAENEQGRVFERFYQVEKARSGPNRGTGLGLSIVRHAVAAMNGRVKLVSRPGEGTSVSVTIPQPSGARQVLTASVGSAPPRN